MGTVINLQSWKTSHEPAETAKSTKIAFPLLMPSWPFGWFWPMAVVVTIDVFNL